MKKMLIIFLGTILFGFTHMAFSKELKLCVIDFQNVIEKSKIAKDMNSKIQKEFQPKEEQLTAKRNTLQKKMADLQKNRTVMKEGEVSKSEDEVSKLKRELEQEAEDFQKSLQKSQTEASKKFTERVQTEISKIAKSKGCTVVVQKAAVAYQDDESVANITESLIDNLAK